MDINSITTALENALKIATGIPGVFGALFVAFIAAAMAALLIANYFVARGQRESAAYTAQTAAAAAQAQALQQLQADASQAMIDNMDTVYAQDYAYFVQVLSLTPPNTEAVVAKVSIATQKQLVGFLYDTTLTPQQKAAQVVIAMKSAAVVTT